MVIANDGENFSVGANLVPVLLAAQEGEWDELNTRRESLPAGQHGAQVSPPKPVVRPPSPEPSAAAARSPCIPVAQASAELYMGQVELGVGLIPSAGGCKELMLRLKDARKAFELIGFVKVSTSAPKRPRTSVSSTAARPSP